MTNIMASNSRPRFVERECVFDPSVDLQEVDQFGFVNLNECFDKGIIPGFAEFSDESFNGVQNPGTLIPRSMDVFDGMRKAEYVRGFLSRMNKEEREKTEAAAAAAAGDVTA